jgi:tRNA A-37 threonylcarbamoyl transferase component Bud32/tetratricopeptide (TPR) repeat protein
MTNADTSLPPPAMDGGLTSGETSTLERLRTAIADRYQIEGQLGQGGAAIVFRARDVRHDRPVAIKVLRPQIALSIGVERFLAEIRLEARLQHPGIVPLFDSGVVGGLPYYVMPLVEGETLRAKLRREGQLAIEEAIAIAREVGEALHYAHTHGYIHRDIKPENILLTNGRALLADFGIARAMGEAAQRPRTETGVVQGTPAYMSPEQGGGDQRLTERSDQYALGCVVFEMLVGEPPFTGASVQAIIARHLADTARLVSVDRPTIPQPMAQAIARALAKAPADRFPSVRAFLEALSRPGGARVRRRVPATAGAMLLLAIAGAWWILRPRPLPLDANKVVVFPLAERGLGVSDSGAGYDATVMLTQAFEHAEPLRWIDVRSRLADYGVRDIAGLGSAQATRIARERGARYYITGLARQARDSVSVVLQLHDAAGDSLVMQTSSTAARAEGTLPNVALDAARAVLPTLLGGRRIDLSPLIGREPGAVALWMQGERSYRESRFAEALAFYGRAVARDSGLALAAVGGAAAASWLGDVATATPFLEVALRAEQMLPAKHALYARGLDTYLRGVADSAAWFLGQALDRDPEWPEAHMALGEVYYHLIPELALSPQVAAQAEFKTAVRLDSLFAPPLVHLSEAAIRAGDRETAMDLLGRLRVRDPDAELVQHLELMLTCLGDGQPPDGWAAEVRRRSYDVFTAADALAAGASQPRCAKEPLRELLAGDVPVGQKWGAFLLLHGLLAAEGRWSETAALVDSMTMAGSRLAETLYVIDLTLGAPFEAQAEAVHRFIVGAVGEDYARTSRPFTLWLMGTWHAHRGEMRRTEALASRLDSLGAGDPRNIATRLGRGLRARVRLTGGDSAGATTMLRSIVPTAATGLLAWDFAESHPVERLLLARLLLASGATREALLVAEGFDHAVPAIYLPFVPASLELRYAAARELRETAAAMEYRERLVRLGRWDDAMER